MNSPVSVGTILSGSLNDGLLMRISASIDLESIRVGSFVAIQGTSFRFFSLITDVRLAVSHPDIVLFPPSPSDAILTHVLKSHGTHAVALLRPLLTLDERHRVLPVTTIPSHFAPVFCAQEQDIAHIFGSEHETERPMFAIGRPPDMHVSVCVDMRKLAERSTGIFGKTGTGKTFVTRLILAGLISKRAAVCLIFDMHSEYGFQARTEEKGAGFVKGLKTLFPQRVAIFSLDPAATQRRGLSPDHVLAIGYRSIRVEDVLALQEEFNLHSTACEAAHLLAARYHERWLETLLSQGDALKELAQSVGAHPESIAALYRKLKHLERLNCFRKGSEHDTDHAIDDMIALIDKGTSIIIEFGNYTSTLCYLLVANIITRRIHELYIAKTEQFLASQRSAEEPRQLVIVIEEAHKFLHPAAARQTTFGTIAREMRKYYVSLLVVDQRPSGIDPEILSQIGTKLVAQLSDERDMQAILVGTSAGTSTKSLLSVLGSKQQLVIFGHAVPMPLLIETRRYDEALYRALLTPESTRTKSLPELVSEIY